MVKKGDSEYLVAREAVARAAGVCVWVEVLVDGLVGRRVGSGVESRWVEMQGYIIGGLETQGHVWAWVWLLVLVGGWVGQWYG